MQLENNYKLLKINKEHYLGRRKMVLLSLSCIFIAILLYLRDVIDLNINKNVFMIIVFITNIFLAKIEYIIAFQCFLIPLYVGIPGNYISLIFLSFLLYEALKKNKFKVNILQLLLFLLVIIIEVWNANDSTFNSVLYFIFEFIIIFILINLDIKNYNSKLNITIFGIGTITLCSILLGIGLKYFSFEEFITGYVRFGDITEYYGVNYNNMILTMDPNFIGMFCIISIITNYICFYFEKNKLLKLIYIALMIGLSFFGFITLSRTFFILYLIFIICTMTMYMKFNIKSMISLIIFFVLILIGINFVNNKFPEIATTFEQRFQESNSTTLGGRTDIISMYLNAMKDRPQSILIGSGLMSQLSNLNISHQVHNTTLQYFVGFGILGSLIVVIFITRVILKKIKLIGTKIYLYSFAPMVIYVFYIQMLPAAYPINFVFISIITLYSFEYYNYKKRREYEK